MPVWCSAVGILTAHIAMRMPLSVNAAITAALARRNRVGLMVPGWWFIS